MESDYFLEYQNSLNLSLESLKTVKNLVDKYLPEDEEITKDIADITTSYCVVNNNIEKIQRATKNVANDIKDENTNEDISATFKKIGDSFKEYYNEDITEIEVTTSPIWKEIFTNDDIQEVTKKEKKLSNAQYEQLDDSLLCSNKFTPPVDPILKKVIRNPYVNRYCGHIFDKDVILTYIQEKKSKAKCPYMGCNNAVFRERDLKFNEKLKAKIDEYYLNQTSDSEDE